MSVSVWENLQQAIFWHTTLVRNAIHHVNLSYLFMRVYDGVWHVRTWPWKIYISSLILIMVTKDKSIYSESQGTSTMSTEKLFTFVCLAHWWIDLILRTWAESDRMYRNMKHCTCPVEIYVQFCVLWQLLTPHHCRKTAQISSSQLINQGQPRLRHYDQYCK